MLPLGQQAKAQFPGIRAVFLAVRLDGQIADQCAAVPQQQGVVLAILRPAGNEGFGLGRGCVRGGQTKKPHLLRKAKEGM